MGDDVTAETINVIQYGDKFGLFSADGSMVQGDFESRADANEAKASKGRKANGGGEESGERAGKRGKS